MIFIHNYAPKYTAKLIELGIAKKGDGFKISQHYATPDQMRFNNIAKKGGELYNIVKELGSCFYIDRLQGGTFYSEYDYDEELLAEYEKMTEFLGFQGFYRVEQRFGHLRAASEQKNVRACFKGDAHTCPSELLRCGTAIGIWHL